MKNLWKKIYGGLVVSFLLLTLPLSVWAEKVIILHTNDIHCGVEDNIGLAKVAQYKKDLLKETPYVALVDAGDAVPVSYTHLLWLYTAFYNGLESGCGTGAERYDKPG